MLLYSLGFFVNIRLPGSEILHSSSWKTQFYIFDYPQKKILVEPRWQIDFPPEEIEIKTNYASQPPARFQTMLITTVILV
jgi:hypothetical protein